MFLNLSEAENTLGAAEDAIGHRFSNPELLRTALTHSSFSNENRLSGAVSNERLEFLGDAILGMTVAEILFKLYPSMPEGSMTRLRAELVCEQSLHSVALRLNLGSWLYLGKGEERNGGRERPSILADAVEAVIAALYLDAGIQSSSSFIQEHILLHLRELEDACVTDFKTSLQEVVQRRSGQELVYVPVRESGPDHDKLFEVHVLLNGEPLGAGCGRTKKEAEQAAAQCAMQQLAP